MRRILYAVFYPIIWLGDVIGRVLRILLFPFAWLDEHIEQLIMLCFKFFFALFIFVVILLTCYLIAWLAFGPFNDETNGHVLGWLIVTEAILAAIYGASRLLSWLFSLGQPK